MLASSIVKQNERIILFDGVCNLCSGWVQFVYQRESQAHFKFVSVQSETGQMLLQWSGLPTDRYETMVYIEHGQAYFKSDAFLQIVSLLKKPWPLINTGKFIPKFMRDWMYDRVARNRYRLFGRRKLCMLPSKPLKQRFL